MGRIRYLKPEFFKDEDLAELDFEYRLLFAGLWNIADRRGRLEDRPKRIKIEVFPYENVDVEKGLSLLANPKQASGQPYIIRYINNKDKYIQIVNWEKHQKPHHTEKESIIPPPDIINGDGDGKGNGEVQQSRTDLSNGEIPVKNKNQKEKPDLKYPILYLNERTGSNFSEKSESNIRLIKARYNEGRTKEEFKRVIDTKCDQWLNNDKMLPYLRPKTLFSATNFESYLNERTGYGIPDSIRNLK